MELLNKCRKLKEYALFIDMVRYYLKQVDQYTKEQAIEKAIDTCIEQPCEREVTDYGIYSI